VSNFDHKIESAALRNAFAGSTRDPPQILTDRRFAAAASSEPFPERTTPIQRGFALLPKRDECRGSTLPIK
jgi:hypothetical protein